MPTKSQASVAMGFVTGMLAGLQRQNIDPEPLLHSANIDISDSNQRIPIARYAALYNLINRHLDDEAFGLFPSPCAWAASNFSAELASTHQR